MKTCVACGHQLGLGRFCTNCGHPVDPAAPTPAAAPADAPAGAPAGAPADWRTDTAERAAAAQTAAPPPSAPPRVPPSAVTPPPPPRYPLYADEVYGSAPPTEDAPAPLQTEPAVETSGEQDWAEDYDEEWEDDGRRSWLPWVAGLLLLVVLGVGAWVTWEYVQEEPGSAPSDTQTQSQEPSDSPGADEVDVAAGATAIAPETAPPSEDVDGELVSYDASNMLDGVPQTAWRVAGDATGMRLTFKLAERTTLTRVGILNGYAKRSEDGQGRRFDWYRGNRRVEAVVWEFGDGTSVRQKLADDRNIQSIDIEPVATRKVVLRLVEVSEPGEGRSARDFTAISEVSLVGQPPA